MELIQEEFNDTEKMYKNLNQEVHLDQLNHAEQAHEMVLIKQISKNFNVLQQKFKQKLEELQINQKNKIICDKVLQKLQYSVKTYGSIKYHVSQSIFNNEDFQKQLQVQAQQSEMSKCSNRLEEIFNQSQDNLDLTREAWLGVLVQGGHYLFADINNISGSSYNYQKQHDYFIMGNVTQNTLPYKAENLKCLILKSTLHYDAADIDLNLFQNTIKIFKKCGLYAKKQHFIIENQAMLIMEQILSQKDDLDIDIIIK